MRILRALTVGVVAAALVACADDDGGPTTPRIPPLAFVRYINAVPDTFNTTVRWQDQVEFRPQTFVNVPFRGMGQGGYQGTQAGSQRLRVFLYDGGGSVAINSTVLVDTSFTLEAGKYYTMLHLGFARAGSTPRQRLVITEDVRPTPGTGNIALRAYHAALGVGNVDVYVTPTTTSPISGPPTFANVAFQTGTAYATLTPGAFAARVTAAGSTTPLISAAAPAGVAGTTTADPIGGATVGGSVISAFAFGASVAGSPAAASPTPSVVYFIDRQPPRTTSP